MSFGSWSKKLTRRDKNTPTQSTKADSAKLSSEPLPYGLKILAEGINPILDIVAIHGLNGHRESTWTVNGVNWLRDLLPSNIPNARIYSWGYDANTHSTSRLSAQYLYDHARTLISDLCLERKMTKTQTLPIIFVAHSLGGIVLKSALIHSKSARRGALEEQQSIEISTYGILFMGTPHQGGNGVSLGELMLNVASIFVEKNSRILQHLERDSEWLQQQQGQYAPISGDFITKFAYEIYPTPIAVGKSIMVVPRASAVVPGVADAEPIAIPADHLNMVKFASSEDTGYKTVSGHLWLLAKEAPDAISVRWAEQDKIKKSQTNVKENFSIPFSLFGVPETEQFVGREEELIRIKEAFQGHGSQRKVVLLCGLGGIGKTQLAVAFLKRYRDIYPAIFWINGKNEDTLKQSFEGVAKRLYKEYPSSTLLRTAVEEKDGNRVVTAINQWLSTRGNDQWILVFDNVDNPKLPGISDPQAYDIRPYFPEAHQGSILITTRSSRLTIGEVVSVKKLVDIQESITILASMSGRENLDQDPCAINLVEELDGLPLALATAGAYLSQVAISLKDYLRHYRTSWLRVQQTTPGLLSYEGALYTTWDLSFQHIQKQNKSAGHLLQLWAYFDNQELWFELLNAGKEDSPEWFASIIYDELSFIEITRLLCDHALIESITSSKGYGMHTCVHAWVTHVLNAKREISMARLALKCVGFAVPTRDVPEYWARGRRLLPHARKCLESIYRDIEVQSPDNRNIYQAIHSLGYLYADQGKMQEAEAMYRRVLEGIEKAWGPEHTSTLSTVNNLGLLYADQGKMQEAEAMYRRALEGKEKAWGPEHTFTLNTVNSLGLLYADQGKMQEAEAMYRRALEGFEKAWGPEHTSSLGTVHNLGNLYKNQGKMQEAEAMYRRALEGFEKAWGPEHTSTLDTVNYMGVLYADQGKMQEAEAMYRRALDGFEKAWGPEHTSTLDTVGNLGNLYRNQGKMQEAEAMYRRALEGFEKAWGPEHTSTLSTVNNLGLLYANQGKMQEAEAMYRRVLEGFEKALGPEHTSTLDTVHNLGLLYANQGKMQEAEAMYRRALEGKEKAWGLEHTSTLDTVNNLGALYSDQGKMQEAEAMYRRALEGYEKAWGPEHTSTLNTVHNLGNLYKNQGKMQEAEAMYRRALEGKEKAWGPEHTSTLSTVNSLGLLYADQGKMQEAEAMYRRALEGFEKAWGPEHTSTLVTVNNLGNLYKNQGKMQEAEAMFRRGARR